MGEKQNLRQEINHWRLLCGAQAMDVTGRDKTWVPSKGTQKVIVKRSIGQWDRT